ncbi:MAG: D-cysteine desulfhydrase family protein [Bdellovibrionales bacterium]|nr:D-cysteine desulfhydrase family protein [Bdellovibrionales bacterium]
MHNISTTVIQIPTLSPSIQDLPTELQSFPRVRLAHLPTPLCELKGLSKSLQGPRILMKCDDLTGFADGGNKVRKLEFLVGQAVSEGSDSIITCGGPQSNHCRQTAAAAARCGLACHLLISGEETENSHIANLLLDSIFGATLHWIGNRNREEEMENVATKVRHSGGKPYIIPAGGSNSTGTLGYCAAFIELWNQLQDANIKVDHIIFPTASGGTQAGLALGASLKNFKGKITGISIDQSPDKEQEYKFCAHLAKISNEASQFLGVTKRFSESDFSISYDYLGAGYGVVGSLEQEAIQLFGNYGLLLDPVYTARTFGALIQLIQKGAFLPEEVVLFWHTGGTTGLHAYPFKTLIKTNL